MLSPLGEPMASVFVGPPRLTFDVVRATGEFIGGGLWGGTQGARTLWIFLRFFTMVGSLGKGVFFVTTSYRVRVGVHYLEGLKGRVGRLEGLKVVTTSSFRHYVSGGVHCVMIAYTGSNGGTMGDFTTISTMYFNFGRSYF